MGQRNALKEITEHQKLPPGLSDLPLLRSRGTRRLETRGVLKYIPRRNTALRPTMRPGTTWEKVSWRRKRPGVKE